MVKIVSWNINGIRGKSMDLFKDKSFNKNSNLGILMKEQEPDIICFSETKCQGKNISTLVWPQNDNGEKLYPYTAWNCSQIKKGYSGTGVLSKRPFINMGSIPTLEDDHEGRSIVLKFDGFLLITVYTPNSGTKSEYRRIWDLQIKQYLDSLLNLEIPVIYCGDLNVVHSPIDIYDPSIWMAEKHSGVLNYEKEGINNIIELGYTDVWRHFNKNVSKYTWWNPRVNARLRGIGWRIDYFLVRDKDMDRVLNVDILDEVKGSDHCPILLEFQ